MKMKLIVHINENAKWNMLFSNLTNLVKKYQGTEYSIIVVINADAVNNVIDSKTIEMMNLFDSNAVIFKACNNSLVPRNIDKTTLDNVVKVVDSSVVEIASKQFDEGYAYIKL